MGFDCVAAEGHGLAAEQRHGGCGALEPRARRVEVREGGVPQTLQAGWPRANRETDVGWVWRGSAPRGATRTHTPE